MKPQDNPGIFKVLYVFPLHPPPLPVPGPVVSMGQCTCVHVAPVTQGDTEFRTCIELKAQLDHSYSMSLTSCVIAGRSSHGGKNGLHVCS